MIKQTLVFTNPAYLSLKNKQLVIDTLSDKGVVTRPVEDIGLIILESRSITVTTALLSYLMDNNVAVMVCDSKHMPAGILSPLAGNSLLTEKTRHQLNASLPLKKQLWQQTVSAKIYNQGLLLQRHCDRETGCMLQWSKTVKSGDPDNLEARAAVFYWKNIFQGRSDFLRGEDADPINSLLDYGYAVLRGVMARAIVGAGLIPQIGLFHSNKYNAFCLADDVMEPYRPFVDDLVISIIQEEENIDVLDTALKKKLCTVPVLDVKIGKVRRPLMIAANYTAASLAKCFEGSVRKIVYPEINS